MVFLSAEVPELLNHLGAKIPSSDLPVYTPIDGSQIGSVTTAAPAQVATAVNRAQSAFLT